jgi:LPXTG-motif cell wall-anchored protein
MKQYFIIFFAILAAAAVVLLGVAIKGYRGVVPPSNDYSDWAGPHIIIGWQGIALLIVGIAVVSFLVWIVLRKRKQKAN